MHLFLFHSGSIFCACLAGWTFCHFYFPQGWSSLQWSLLSSVGACILHFIIDFRTALTWFIWLAPWAFLNSFGHCINFLGLDKLSPSCWVKPRTSEKDINTITNCGGTSPSVGVFAMQVPTLCITPLREGGFRSTRSCVAIPCVYLYLILHVKTW